MGAWRIGLGIFLVAHGLVHAALAAAPAPQVGALNTPYWPAWWRTDSGATWLVTAVGMDSGPVRMFGTLLWIVSTVVFTAAGLGLLGVPGLSAWWQPLTIFGAAASLALLVLFWHPWLVLGALLDLAIMVTIMWNRLPSQLSS